MNRFRVLLDSWQFWVGVAYVGLACVVVALWVNYSRVSREQVQTERVSAARHADIVANAEAQYQQCVKSIPALIRINRFLHGVQDEHRILLVNSLASHQATPKDTALWKAQLVNIRRLRRASEEVQGVHFPVPTRKSCVALRDRLLKR